MTEQERNLIRDAMMFAVKDITGRVMREATVQSMIDDFKKAINYTHSCESDSELLKDKEAMTFYEYLLSKGYKMSNKHTWQIDNRDLSYDDIIKQRKEYEYSL